MAHVAASISHAACDYRDEQLFTVTSTIALVGRLWRTHFNDRMKALGQTDARWRTLHAIAGEPRGVIQANLAEVLGIKGPSLVGIIDGLEQQGLVSRRRVSGDRRANGIVIESKGREVLAVLESFALKMRNEAFEGISDADVKTTLSVLSRVSDRLGASSETAMYVRKLGSLTGEATVHTAKSL